MKKRIVVTESQLKEYVERKKAEMVLGSILDEMRRNSKLLGENISLKGANQSIIHKYKLNGTLTPQVIKLLKEYGVVGEDLQIL